MPQLDADTIIRCRAQHEGRMLPLDARLTLMGIPTKAWSAKLVEDDANLDNLEVGCTFDAILEFLG